MDCMNTAFDAGCNFFDNAEAYAAGKSDRFRRRGVMEDGEHDFAARKDA